MGLQQSLRANAGNAGALARALAHALAPDHDRGMKTYFDHEKLNVYQEAIAFCGWVGEFIASINSKLAAKDQLDRASTSIPLNIAEANGKFSDADRARFLEIGRGSSLECAACLDVVVARELAKPDDIIAAKEQLVRIVNMLMGLLKRFSGRAEFLREDELLYRIDHDQEQEHDHEATK
jgi:four helix bundle protein